MARITVEDCLKKIPNRFEMVLCAAYRARLLSQGHAPKIDAKDKPTVIALRARGATCSNVFRNCERATGEASLTMCMLFIPRFARRLRR